LSKVLDTDSDTNWYTGAGSSHWIKLEFDSPQEVISARINTNKGYDYRLQYSDNDSTWSSALEITKDWNNEYDWDDSFEGLNYVYLLGGIYTEMHLEAKQARPDVEAVGGALSASWEKDILWVEGGVEASHSIPSAPRNAPDFGMLRWHYSGGVSNSDEANSLGGMLSNTLVPFQNFYILSSISGITVNSVVASGVSWGRLTFEKIASGYYFEWMPSGVYSGAGVTTFFSGDITILAGGDITKGYIKITLDLDLLGDSGELNVFIQNQPGNVFTKVDATEAAAGSTIYRGLYIHNTHGSKTYRDLALYIEEGFDDAQVSMELAVEEAPLQTIANETTAPTATSFSTPTFSAPLVIGNIDPGMLVGVWLKRTVASNCVSNVYNLVATIGMKGRYA